jgi:multidrug efflux pump subunit AcrB
MLTLLPLGWRAAGIVMISIPLSLAFGIIVLYFLGYSLNQLSIAGFVVALGLLVDDSIVAVENIAAICAWAIRAVQAAIARHEADLRRDPRLHRHADVRLPATDGSARHGRQVHPRAATAVVATIVGSLLIALFIIPFLASRILKPDETRRSTATCCRT